MRMPLNGIGYKRQCKKLHCGWFSKENKYFLFFFFSPWFFLPFLLQKQLVFKIKQARIYQGTCGLLEGSTHRLLLITGCYLEKNNLPVMCNLQCGLWKLVLWPCNLSLVLELHLNEVHGRMNRLDLIYLWPASGFPCASVDWCAPSDSEVDDLLL